MQKIYGIVDCNNFFVSCELLFKPQYKNNPTVVLSNNDGCVVSRSNGAKKIGIPMGAPMFKYKNLFEKNRVKVFSANFALYGDISNRVMKIIKDNVEKTQVYSIDEAFMDLSNISKNKVEAFCAELRSKILQYTGIPTSIGISSTKTLAKVANGIAKKNTQYNGVLHLSNNVQIDENLKNFDISDIWGIGRNLTPKLKSIGITNAFQIKNLDKDISNKFLNVSGRKTILELNGVDCISLRTRTHRSIISSRSFGRPVSSINDLEEAISQYVATASRKLRNKKLVTHEITVYLTTNYHKKHLPQYRASKTISTPYPTAYTPIITRYAIKALREIYRGGYIFKKVGVVLTRLSCEEDRQYSYITNLKSHDLSKNKRIMNSIDKINHKWGGGAIKLFSEGIEKTWTMKYKSRSQAYTSRWNEILEINI